jgi:LPS-assembly protein
MIAGMSSRARRLDLLVQELRAAVVQTRAVLLVPATAALLLTCVAPATATEAESPAAPQPAPVAPLRCPAPASASLGAAAPAPIPPRAPADPNAPIDISSDEASVAVDGSSRLLGNVRVTQGDRRIRADDVQYDAAKNGFVVRGAVEYEDPVLRVRGGNGEYSAAGGATFEGAEFELPLRPARGAARSMTLDTQGVVSLADVRFSTCPSGDPAWQIRARSISLDTRERSGTGRDAAIEFKGVPLLYLPYLSFPLGSQRMSGFLFPSIGYTSRSGAQASVPYYWNIAPQQDLTLQPTLYSRRGFDLGGEYRYLGRTMQGALTGNLLPSDRIDGGDRHRLQWQHLTRLPGSWRVNFDAEDVSDPEYFEDFASGSEGTSVPFLSRRARIGYRDAHWFLQGDFQEFQTIDRALPLIDRPYATVPRLIARGATTFGADGLMRLGFDSELVNFQRSTGITGWRLDAEPSVSVDLQQLPGVYVRPTAGVRYTRYRLDDTPSGIEDSPTRSVPWGSLDLGAVFERPAGSDGQRRVTMEPRVLYLYAPYRDQSALPVFDTTVPDLNYVQLFRTNRYVGGDRMADANQVSVGVQGALYDGETGSRFIAATIGQTYYFAQPRVLLPGEAPRRRGASDLIAQLALTAYKDWNVDLGVQWNPDTSREERAQARLQYRPAADRIVNLLYRRQRDRLSQGEASGAWPLGSNWNLFARWIYDFQETRSLERFAGVEYKACCWRLRAVARRFVSTRTGEQDTGVYLQLELNGLASVGSSADTFLEQAVRGYSPSAAVQ